MAPAGWLVVLTRHGATAGAVGPFDSADDAREWAESAGLDRRGDGWRWAVEPLFDHADLPAPAPAPRRRHLTLVR